MNIYSLLLFILLLLAGMQPLCAQTASCSFNKILADSLERMAANDQVAAKPRTGAYKALSSEAWQAFKDSVFGTHHTILEKIFDQHGFPGYDLVGKEGSYNFWLMVQHCDHWVAFQEKVLQAMKKELEKGNANPENYAFLIDRIRLNTGRKQLYGTQVTFNLDSCQSLPRPMEDSLLVNTRRKALGMEPLEEYLNSTGTSHFLMNRAMYEEKGIKKPKLYTVPR